MLVLSQFVLRLSFGLALAMGLTSPRKVTSGFFRNHSYVLLGLNVVATLAALAPSDGRQWLVPLTAAVLSYLAAAAWLYERPAVGRGLLWLVAGVSIAAAWLAQSHTGAVTSVGSHSTIESVPADAESLMPILRAIDPIASGFMLGTTITAMFLGHWYLNTPTMELAPLRRLLGLMALAITARAVTSGLGLVLQTHIADLSTAQWLMIALRWLAGIIGTGILTWMAWQTLKIPNTQSATGILYVAVITVFIGELTSLLLSGGASFPV